ncbi:metal-dependent hydrolase [Utexia brackfieldae]|uniref:metal-dependent hydrolase n=1 Tax=Utexia brackfieldae TaxID=3074108 RepID=UPI00370D7EE2
MQLKTRTVPKDVFAVMNLNDDFKHLWIPDNVMSLIGLGTSYLLEFFEFYGEKVSGFYDRFVKGTEYEDDRFPVFIAQERRHAAAHKNLNRFMAKNYAAPSREKYHPRVYDFMYVTYKEFVEPNIAGLIQDEQMGKTLDSPYFKEALRTIATFETEVCMASFSFYENLIDHGKLDVMMDMSENLGVLYLLGYHYAEEMEHCSVSIETYEKIYHEPLWSKERIKQYEAEADLLTHRVTVATLYVARMLGIEVTVKQIRARLPNYRGLVSEGFNAKSADILPKIKYFVEHWDNQWEPMLRAKIKQTIDDAQA